MKITIFHCQSLRQRHTAQGELMTIFAGNLRFTIAYKCRITLCRKTEIVDHYQVFKGHVLGFDIHHAGAPIIGRRATEYFTGFGIDNFYPPLSIRIIKDKIGD